MCADVSDTCDRWVKSVRARYITNSLVISVNLLTDQGGIVRYTVHSYFKGDMSEDASDSTLSFETRIGLDGRLQGSAQHSLFKPLWWYTLCPETGRMNPSWIPKEDLSICHSSSPDGLIYSERIYLWDEAWVWVNWNRTFRRTDPRLEAGVQQDPIGLCLSEDGLFLSQNARFFRFYVQTASFSLKIRLLAPRINDFKTSLIQYDSSEF